jgi:hypothetical protein
VALVGSMGMGGPQAKARRGHQRRARTYREVPPTVGLAGTAEPPPDAGGAHSWWTGRRIAGVVVAGVGLLGIGGGLVFAGMASSKADDAATIQNGIPLGGCPGSSMCSALNDTFDTEHTDHVISETMLIAGGVGVVGGAVLLLWPTSPAGGATRTSWIQPYFAGRGGGLQLRGDF